MPIEMLAGRQNPDGGWPYVQGRSWTEPTVYAVMAMLAVGEKATAQKGLRWILAGQRKDGGWAPQPGVDESTWVTALVALLPPEHLGYAHDRAIAWLLETKGEETSFTYRLREHLLGNQASLEKQDPGWPWVPGAAAWVGPTAIALLALVKEARRKNNPEVQTRIEAGRRFLLSRMCVDGGWNHGSVRALGYESRPYPETTGMGLVAMRGVKSPKIEQSLSVARGFLNQCHSADALNWLRLGLLAHDQLPAGFCPPAAVEYRTLIETALQVLVSAVEKGNNLFWS